MQLTEAGSVLVNGLKGVLSSYDAAVETAQSVYVRANELRIGFHGPMNWGTIPALLATFREQLPLVRINVRTDHWGTLIHDLNLGLLDLVFTESHETEEYPNLKSLFLFRDYPCVCMSIKNPLAERTVIYPADLSEKQLIMTNSLNPSRSMTAIISGLKACGIQIEEAQYVNQVENAFTMAAANLGITFLPRSFKTHEYRNLVFRNLEQDRFYMDMLLAYSEERLSQAGKQFVDLCSAWDFRAQNI